MYVRLYARSCIRVYTCRVSVGVKVQESRVRGLFLTGQETPRRVSRLDHLPRTLSEHRSTWPGYLEVLVKRNRFFFFLVG